MKTLYLVTLLCLLMLNASAQSVENVFCPSDISIVQKQWKIEVRNPALDEDPFLANNELRQAERDKKENLRQNAIRIRQGKQPELPPVRMRPIETAARETLPTFVYQIKLKNTGEKTIQTIIWEYVFWEPITKQEVGRLQFINKVNIEPGKTKNLVMRTLSPPAKTVNVSEAGKKLREQYFEQVIMRGIEYTDGSTWEAAGQKNIVN